MKLQVLCATKDKEGVGPTRLVKAFPGATMKQHTIVPDIIVGGPRSLRDVVKRYEGAATYLGPNPATIWMVTLVIKNKVDDPQRMRETCIELCRSGLLIDMEVSLPDEPELAPDVAVPSQPTVREDIHD